MGTWAKWAARAAIVATGFAVASSGLTAAALAAVSGTHPGDVSVLAGTRVTASADVPVEICGVAVGVIGQASADCQGGATNSQSSSPQVTGPAVNGAASTTISGGISKGNVLVGGGGNITIAAAVPITVCGISIAILGSSRSSCQSATAGSPASRNAPSPASRSSITGSISVSSDNAVSAAASATVTACGDIVVGLIGSAAATCPAASPAAAHAAVATSGVGPSVRSSASRASTPFASATGTSATPRETTGPAALSAAQQAPGAGGDGPTNAVGPAVGPAVGLLPITGVNLIGIVAAALGCIGVGGALVVRRRRTGNNPSRAAAPGTHHGHSSQTP